MIRSDYLLALNIIYEKLNSKSSIEDVSSSLKRHTSETETTEKLIVATITDLDNNINKIAISNSITS